MWFQVFLRCQQVISIFLQVNLLSLLIRMAGYGSAPWLFFLGEAMKNTSLYEFHFFTTNLFYLIDFT